MSSYNLDNNMSTNNVDSIMSDNNTDSIMTNEQSLNNTVNPFAPPQASSSITTAPPGPQRRKINKDFTKDTKTKTAKCKICGDRIKTFSHQCGTCKLRICSDCSEADGANTDAHKAVARDYLDEGCWCGFASKFNPAFKDRMPGVKMRDESTGKTKAGSSAAASGSTTGKRKRTKSKKAVEAEAEASPELDATAAGAESESPDNPFKIRTPTAAMSTEYFYVQPSNNSTLPESRSTNDADVESSSPVQEAQEPPRKRRKSNDSTPKTPADDVQDPFLTQQNAGNSSSSLSSAPSVLNDPASEAIEADQSPQLQRSTRSSNSSENIVLAGPPPPQQAEVQTSRPRRSTRALRAQPTPSTRKTKQPAPPAPKAIPPPVLEDHIVIIGAGAIGMFTALQLAQKSASKGKKQKITVVDINSEPFALASGHSAGFLTTHGMKESCDKLMAAAINEWNELTQSADFRKAVKLSSAVFSPTDDESLAPSTALPWFRAEEGRFTAEDTNTLGLLSPASLSAWLYRSCQRLGVLFRFDHQPTEIKRDRAGVMTGVIIKHAAEAKKKPELLSCAHLLLAAGAFTPDLAARLFPSGAPRPAAQALQSAQWVRFDHLPLPATTTTAKQGVLLPRGEASPISLISHPARRSVILSAAWPLASARRLGAYDALANPVHDAAALRKLAGEALVVEGVDFSRIGTTDACYVSARPVLGEVGGMGVGARVWLAYGFGMVGTTVAPGVGKVLAERVLGEGKGKVDLGGFGGECGVVGGKGKGRAV
ncbi:hypothetical protein M409DRAFT_50816 [Zasmidium cellare ATCC 36951]|uniref:FAD dependent oxidoreductase domain-containing protein n=1 Tax=Zasmidium cellare ATCC 36951 TaxID=1080233 RepID=A0A6A6D139_ZASCE|nr:uncharacterized protein M409DRAFT_50816 [Zasmidium cellare ATCC 36951]KAF2171366.1 hypothetical protein M409DRAFT_50816 [Zasmidium cellare ATCC 36951]